MLPANFALDVLTPAAADSILIVEAA